MIKILEIKAETFMDLCVSAVSFTAFPEHYVQDLKGIKDNTQFSFFAKRSKKKINDHSIFVT